MTFEALLEWVLSLGGAVAVAMVTASPVLFWLLKPFILETQ